MTIRTYRMILAVVALINIGIIVGLPVHMAGAVLAVLITAKAAVLTLMYGLRSPWWSTAIGRALLMTAAAMGAVSTLSALWLFGIRYPYDARTLVVSTAVFGFTFMRFVLIVLRLQREEAP